MILGFLMLIIWYLADSNISIFKRTSKSIGDEEEWGDENIHALDFPQQINAAVNQQDYRLATRLMFLQLLKRMDEFNIIEYHHDFTNNDYRQHLKGTRFATSFDVVARHYEFVWYGKRQPNPAHYEEIKIQFTRLDNQLAAA
jgi:hypothetical protein